MTGFVPRPYQEHAVLGGDPRRGIGIMPAFARYKRVLVVMATGCGKTETFLWVIRRFLESIKTPAEKRAMVLAHRDELMGQPIERAPRFGLRFAREQGPETALGKPERAIASTIQSMTANRVRAAATALGYRFEKKRKKDPAQTELAPVKREKGGKFTVWSPAGAELGRFDIEEFTKYFKEAHPGVPTCRMEEYDPNEIGLIVIDECHHAAAHAAMGGAGARADPADAAAEPRAGRHLRPAGAAQQGQFAGAARGQHHGQLRLDVSQGFNGRGYEARAGRRRLAPWHPYPVEGRSEA